MGPCPACGRTGKFVKAVHTDNALLLSGSLSWMRWREYVKANRKVQVLMWTLTVGSAIIGLRVTGLYGVMVSLITGFVGNHIGNRASVTVREFVRGGADSDARPT